METVVVVVRCCADIAVILSDPPVSSFLKVWVFVRLHMSETLSCKNIGKNRHGGQLKGIMGV